MPEEMRMDPYNPCLLSNAEKQRAEDGIADSGAAVLAGKETAGRMAHLDIFLKHGS